jgi:hypothetical protein
MNESKEALSEASISPRIKKSKAKSVGSSHGDERRVATPRADLIVVKIGEPYFKRDVLTREKPSSLVAKIAKAIRKPGTSRQVIFRSSVGKKVYVYSVDPRDTTKIIRENANGQKKIGRLVNGRFRPVSAQPL